MTLLEELKLERPFYWIVAINDVPGKIVKIRKNFNPPEVEAFLQKYEQQMIRDIEDYNAVLREQDFVCK